MPRREELLLAEMIDAHPEVNWSRPSQLRNRIIHGYWSIDVEILHETATDQLPDYVAALRQIAAEGL